MKVYDKSEIGRRIARGTDHVVYEYGTGKVIKFSTMFFLLGKRALPKALRDHELSQKYFGEYLLETDIEVSRNGKYVVRMQPKIFGHPLTLRDLENPEIRTQSEEIFKRHDEMCAAGHREVDLIGHSDVWKPELGNIFVMDTGDLRIIDASIFRPQKTGLLAPGFWLLRAFLIWRQTHLMRIFRRQA